LLHPSNLTEVTPRRLVTAPCVMPGRDAADGTDTPRISWSSWRSGCIRICSRRS